MSGILLPSDTPITMCGIELFDDGETRNDQQCVPPPSPTIGPNAGQHAPPPATSVRCCSIGRMFVAQLSKATLGVGTADSTVRSRTILCM
eukprot:5785363-Prymnesium_polylepis.3